MTTHSLTHALRHQWYDDVTVRFTTVAKVTLSLSLCCLPPACPHLPIHPAYTRGLVIQHPQSSLASSCIHSLDCNSHYRLSFIYLFIHLLLFYSTESVDYRLPSFMHLFTDLAVTHKQTTTIILIIYCVTKSSYNLLSPVTNYTRFEFADTNYQFYFQHTITTYHHVHFATPT